MMINTTGSGDCFSERYGISSSAVSESLYVSFCFFNIPFFTNAFMWYASLLDLTFRDFSMSENFSSLLKRNCFKILSSMGQNF